MQSTILDEAIPDCYKYINRTNDKRNYVSIKFKEKVKSFQTS